MTVIGRQNDTFTNNYAHYTLRGAPCPTLPYITTAFRMKCNLLQINFVHANVLNRAYNLLYMRVL